MSDALMAPRPRGAISVGARCCAGMVARPLGVVGAALGARELVIAIRPSSPVSGLP